MTKASDNAFPSLLITEGTVPASPAAGKQRLYVDSTSHLLKLVNSSGTASTVGSAASLTSTSADSSAAVTLTADTITDATGCSVSLAAGTWIVVGQMIFSNTGLAAVYALQQITDSSNAIFSEIRATATGSLPFGAFCVALVTPGSTTTYKLRGQMGGGGTMKIERYSQGTTIGTRIAAVKIA